METAERLQHLEHVFDDRRASLAAAIVREPARRATTQPLVTLQDHGYSLALSLALTALLPTVIGMAFRRRKLVFNTLATVLRIRKWRTRAKALTTTGRRR